MEHKEYTLASGKKIKVTPGVARDFVKAQMMAQVPEETPLALISMLVEFDGHKMTMEDVGDMPISDFVAVLPFLGLSPGILPSSSSVSAGKRASDTRK